jgi:large subunit ribosomal protein L25
MQVITASTREGLGKEAARKVRNAGQIPAVFYGFGAEKAVSISLDPQTIEKALSGVKGKNGYFTFELDGNENPNRVLIREIQRHPVTRRVLHVDLVSPNPENKIVSTVPLRFEGRSVGVSMGGRMRKPYREIKVHALPENMPGEVLIDVTNLDQGDSITVSQLEIEDGNVIYDRDYVIVKVVAPRGGNK